MVAAGGAAYNPLATELRNGMTVLARDVQYTMFTGDASFASGATTNEGGQVQNTAAFDGMRLILGSVAGSNYATNNAIQADIGTLNINESVKFVASKGANAGGFPDLAFMSMNSKEALDTEMGGSKRYNDNTVQIIAGVYVNQIQSAAGLIDVLPIPGTTMGTYTSPTTGSTVEDIYVLDSKRCFIRWLYADNFTVLEIPSGVDAQLSSRYIVFGLFGLEIGAPPFMGKVRRVAS